MNWSRKEWSMFFGLVAVLGGTWVLFSATAMVRLGAAGVWVTGLVLVIKGYKTLRDPQARNENWKIKDDVKWGKYAIFAGVVLWIIAAVLAIFVPLLF